MSIKNAETFEGRLARLESRLQYLVEGSLARLFHSQHPLFELSSLIFKAMESHITEDTDGNLLAPDCFTLFMHPDEMQVLSKEPDVLDALAENILLAGSQSGFRFIAHPTIRVVANPEANSGQIRILAEFSHSSEGKTTTMPVEPDRANGDIPKGAFLLIEGTHLYWLNQAVVNIGRRPDNHLVINDRRVSRLHAQLRAIQGTYVIFDLDSTGGTFVNGQRVKEQRLQPGDVISLAGVQMLFGREEPYPSEAVQGSTSPLDL